MTPEQQQLMTLRGMIASMPAEDQLKVKQAEAELRATLLKHGQHGAFAVALIGAEMAAED